MRNIILLLALVTSAAYAQTEMRISQRSPDTGYQFIMAYSGTSIQYICKAASLQPTSSAISIASATNANPVVFTVSGGHGFNTNSKPLITISGGTGSWTAVNLTNTVATVINSTTFSIAVDSTAFGALAGTVTYTTRAPRTTSSIWSVQYFTYDGSGNNTWAGWANGTSSFTNTCSGAPNNYQ